MGFLDGKVEPAQPSVYMYDEQKISRLSDELSKLGYWDEYQNRVALTQSKYNLKNAISLIMQGRVPDLEQGGGDYWGNDVDADVASDFRREFIAQKFS